MTFGMNSIKRLIGTTFTKTRKSIGILFTRGIKNHRVQDAFRRSRVLLQMTSTKIREFAAKSMTMITNAKNVNGVVDFVGGPWIFLSIMILIVTIFASIVVLFISTAVQTRKVNELINNNNEEEEGEEIKSEGKLNIKKGVTISNECEEIITPLKFPSSIIKMQSKGTTPQQSDYDWDDFYNRMAKTGVLVKRIKGGECKARCLSLNVKGKLCLHKLPLRADTRMNSMKPYIKISLMEVKDCFAIDDIIPPQMILELPTKTILLSMERKIDVRFICRGINALVMNLKTRDMQYFAEVKNHIAEHAIAGKAGGLTATNIHRSTNKQYEDTILYDDNHSVATSNTNLSTVLRDGDYDDSDVDYEHRYDDDDDDHNDDEQLRNNTARNRNRIVAAMENDEEEL